MHVIEVPPHAPGRADVVVGARVPVVAGVAAQRRLRARVGPVARSGVACVARARNRRPAARSRPRRRRRRCTRLPSSQALPLSGVSVHALVPLHVLVLQASLVHVIAVPPHAPGRADVVVGARVPVVARVAAQRRLRARVGPVARSGVACVARARNRRPAARPGRADVVVGARVPVVARVAAQRRLRARVGPVARSGVACVARARRSPSRRTSRPRRRRRRCTRPRRRTRCRSAASPCTRWSRCTFWCCMHRSCT